MTRPARLLSRLVALLLALLGPPAYADQTASLSIDITTPPGEDYAAAIALIKQAGASVTSLSLAWDDFETATGSYAPQTDWPAIADAYYPGERIGLILTLSVIDTTADRRPADLKALAWDDPSVIARFNAHLEAVLSRLTHTDLRAIAIGNEVDVALKTPAGRAAFARFLAATAPVARKLRPGVPVATKLTAASLTSAPADWQDIRATGDALFVTYYPLSADFAALPPDAPATDLPALLALAGQQPLFLLEAGYPSAGCGSDPAAQLQFLQSLFTAWRAAGPKAIPLVSLSWLTDIPAAEVATYARYYAVSAPCFGQFLGSLGLRDDTGAAKPALTALLTTRMTP